MKKNKILGTPNNILPLIVKLKSNTYKNTNN